MNRIIWGLKPKIVHYLHHSSNTDTNIHCAGRVDNPSRQQIPRCLHEDPFGSTSSVCSNLGWGCTGITAGRKIQPFKYKELLKDSFRERERQILEELRYFFQSKFTVVFATRNGWNDDGYILRRPNLVYRWTKNWRMTRTCGIKLKRVNYHILRNRYRNFKQRSLQF